jgi:hypothetical protein
MQVNTDRRALGLREKLPDIQKTLDTVRFLKTRKVGPFAEQMEGRRDSILTLTLCIAGFGTTRDDL